MNNFYTKNFKYFAAVSAFIVLVAVVVGIISGGMNVGIDFAGGTIMTIEMGGEFDTADITAVLQKHNLTDAPVIKSGTDPTVKTQAVIRMKTFGSDMEENDVRQQLLKEIQETYPKAELGGVDHVGPVASATLLENAFWSILIASVLMLIYIWIRFELYNGFAAVAALLHDVLIMMAFVTILRVQINSSFIAAVLTIIGYSINNTIVIFDRVRENSKNQKGKFTEEVVNMSIRQSLTRSIYTSLTTLFTITALYFFGVDSIKEFTMPIIVGLLAGTYSSIFMAAPLWYHWHASAELAQKKAKMNTKKKDGKKR